MDGFFEVLSEFLKSDLAKSYGWMLVMSFFLGAVIFGFLMSLLYIKIIVPTKLIEANNFAQEGKKLIDELEKAKERILELEEENKKLNEKIIHYKFIEMTEDSENEESGSFKNVALDKFT